MNCPLPSNQVNLDKACVTCLNASCAQVQQLIAVNACVSNNLQASQVWGDQGYFNSLCATNANFTNACISNLKTGNFIPTTTYRATVNYSADTIYALGSLLNFDNIVDDPNNNVSLTPNMSYTAPVSGYYMMTYKVNITNVLPTSGPILGTPTANPAVYVNGLLVRDMYSSFLSFFNTQKVILDSLITLQAGDVVTMNYNILGGSGLPVAGTVTIVGAGVEDGNSLFKIILLSTLTGGSQQTCPPCPVVTIPCAQGTTPPLGACSIC